MIYYAFAQDPDKLPEYNWSASGQLFTAPEDGKAIIIRVPRACPIEKLVSYIAGETKKYGKIGLLRLCAHGDSGRLYLGGGRKGIGVTDTWDYFKPLRACFDDYRKQIRIHGCAVASDAPLKTSSAGPDGSYTCTSAGFKGDTKAPGFQFLKGLANATGAAVEGAVYCQHPRRDFRFTGPTITVWPDGPYTSGYYTENHDQNGNYLAPMTPDP